MSAPKEVEAHRADIPSLQVLAAAALMTVPENRRNQFQHWLMMKQFGLRLDDKGCYDRTELYEKRVPELVVEVMEISQKEVLKGREHLAPVSVKREFARIVYQAPLFETGQVLFFDDACRNQAFDFIDRDPEEASVGRIPVSRIQDIVASMENCPEEEVLLKCGCDQDRGLVEVRWVPVKYWREPVGSVEWRSAKYYGSTPAWEQEPPWKRRRLNHWMYTQLG